MILFPLLGFCFFPFALRWLFSWSLCFLLFFLCTFSRKSLSLGGLKVLCAYYSYFPSSIHLVGQVPCEFTMIIFIFFYLCFFSVVSITGFKNHRVLDISGLRAQRNYARQFQGALQCNFRQAFSATRYSTLLGVLGGWQIFICTWVALSYVWSCAWSSIEALMSGRLKDLLSVCEGNLRMESPNLI